MNGYERMMTAVRMRIMADLWDRVMKIRAARAAK